ncbi:gelsolin-related protein of 125 kDa [Heracleum sosnowskyi]|uniref:Gelsolin-related protein of 125 kDa n=1 Tax=Heracleum sosnowskyi TaxID=360622 RepID=A0AAD8J1Z0_9APIA|nr:gelsolin-related protein of 125 kDa [Heracleum sosnowskyi]
MKTSSKSFTLSPGKTSSPMFQTGCKKRGSGFENSGSNPEPSSPKVTCIGQVRVKTKKQGEKMRHLSRRRSGDMSFRKIEVQRQSSVNSIHHQQECSSHRNQRWVHLSLTICETLRGFGSEFSCLFPCKSSCFSGERDGRERRDDLVKWLHDEDDFEDEKVIRRHVFDEIEIKDFNEGGRVSLCVPPKNALLLMRCRSDPVKMEALASKVREPKLQIDEDENEEGGEYNDENDGGQYRNQDSKTAGAKTNYCDFLDGNVKEEHVMVSFDKVKVVEVFEERRASISYNIINEVEENEMEIEVQGNDEEKLVEALHVNEEMHEKSEQELVDDSQEVQIGEQKEEKDEASFVSALEGGVSEESDFLVHLDGRKEQEKQELEGALVIDQNESSLVKQQEEADKDVPLQGKGNAEISERGSDRKIKKVEREATQRLPECLLLMMCEPKLSMEVSKETWVCSTDFIRSRPQKKKSHAPHAPPQHKKHSTGDEEPVIKKRNSVDSKCNDNPFAALPPPYPAAQNIQPGRASCCLPAARGGVSMASMIEQKLGDAVAYEPFVLTRCKSEPMKTASKLAQEACFWKNKALEPHRRATFEVGAAGC